MTTRATYPPGWTVDDTTSIGTVEAQQHRFWTQFNLFRSGWRGVLMTTTFHYQVPAEEAVRVGRIFGLV